MITQNDLISLITASNLAGFNVDINDIQLLHWEAGIQTHVPQRLPHESAAVYIFKWNDSYLKVGKANENSNARYQSQHYNAESSISNLSRSLLNDAEFQAMLGEITTSEWLRTNTNRFNIIIPSRLGKKFVHFTEAFFILKCNPIYEA